MSDTQSETPVIKEPINNSSTDIRSNLPPLLSLPTSPSKKTDLSSNEDVTNSLRSNSLPAPPSKLELDFPDSFTFDSVPPSFNSETIDTITDKEESDSSDYNMNKEASTSDQETLTTNVNSTSVTASSEPTSSLAPPPLPTRSSSYTRSTTSTEKEFDYHLFLDQVRLPQALPIMKYLENFVREFDKKPWTIRDQVKIVAEFSDFVLAKMLDNVVWKDAVDPDSLDDPACFPSENDLLDFLQEGVEQYLMNRLHSRAFSPLGSDDRERDHVLQQRIRYFQWVEEKHLDIPDVTQPYRNLLTRAQQELVKLNNFKTPRHKMICLLNCCKYLFKLLKSFSQNSEGGGADTFLPLLIFTVLQANPPKLISNLQYISRFRHPSKLQSEAGYYLTHLIGAIQFIENIEPSSLTITKEEFDANIGKALQDLTAEIPQGGDDNLLVLDLASNPPSSENLSQTTAPFENQSREDLLDRGTQFAQRIKRPLDLVGRFFSDVASPISYPFSQNDDSASIGSSEQINKPAPSVPRSEEVRKKKSFLVSLFSTSSSDEDFENKVSDQDPLIKQGPPGQLDQFNEEEYGQELISFQSEGASSAPPLPPRRISLLNEPLESSQTDTGLVPIPEKGISTSPRVDAAMLNFDQGIGMLRDMFPSFETDVLQAVLSAHHGNLTASTEALLEIAEVNNPYSPQYQEQNGGLVQNSDSNGKEVSPDLITFDPVSSSGTPQISE